MSRRLKLSLAVLAVLFVVVGAFLWALPEVVRRVALVQIPKLTGRAASIEDVDLNLFTGRLAIKKFRLAEREPSESFVSFDRLELGLSARSLWSRHIRLVDLALTTPTVRIVRTGPTEFNFSDLLALIPPSEPSERPSRWTLSVERLALVGGAIVVSDRAVSPAREWRVQGLGFEAGGLTTLPGQPPGHVLVRGQVNEAVLDVRGQGVRLTPTGVAAQISLERFDLAQLRPYLPPGLPAAVERGTLGLALKVSIERGAEGFKTLLVSGQIQVEDLGLTRPDQPAPFLTLSRLSLAIKEADLLARSMTLAGVEADGVDLRAVRTPTGEIDLLAALAERRAAAAAPETTREAPPPAIAAAPTTPPFKARLERLAVNSATVTLTDQTVSPERQWRLDGLTVEGARLSTVSDDGPGTLKLRAQLAKAGGKPPTIALEANGVRLTPAAASARVTLEGFDLADLEPYWPDTLPAVPRAGVIAATIDAGVESGQSGLTRAVASGTIRLTDAAVLERGAPKPFLRVPKVVVNIRRADALARTIDVAAVEIEGVDVRAMRDARGTIDLLGLVAATPTGAPAAGAPPAARVAAAPPPTSAAPGWRLSLDRFALSKASATFEDRAVSPAATFTVGDIKATAERLAWPMTRPATFSLLLSMPQGGWSYVKGTALLDPLNVQLAISTRDTPITPYQTYFPFPARFQGLFNGDSLSEIQRGPKGELILASRGTAWANELQVLAPGVDDPLVRMDSFVISGLDFSWPNYALVDKVAFVHPQVLVERDAQGQINLRTLFTVKKDETPAETATPAPTGATAPPSPAAEEARAGGGLLQTMVIDFTEIALEDGFGRFIDRTTVPPFSEDISRLALKIRGLSNVLGRSERTTLTAQGLVGVDGALDMRGDLSGIGESLRADLVAELHDFSLRSANPYAESLTSWNVQSGTLRAKVHYHVEGDRITAEHDLEFKRLRVEKTRESDEAKRRIGIPLGLAVALLKDSDGVIDFSLPITGTLSDRSFDWGEAMWTAAKQVIGKVLLSPFRAIGRLFGGGDDSVDKLEVNPVTFPPGSAVIAPSLEAQITRLADFLRRSPQIKLGLSPVLTTDDVNRLKEQEVSARLEAFRREERLPDLAAALRVYYQQRVPDAVLPKTVEEQVALLVRREPVPERALAELAARRVAAVSEDLVKTRGIDSTRLVARSVPPAAGLTSGEGRVDLTIVTDQ
jgi:uncharacterized protein involved in outer membrane biogenesis